MIVQWILDAVALMLDGLLSLLDATGITALVEPVLFGFSASMEVVFDVVPLNWFGMFVIAWVAIDLGFSAIGFLIRVYELFPAKAT